ncbi:MAG: elongation factor G [Chloroflexota bacterium]
MERFGLETIRNVVLLSHSGAGKTSLAEAILFTTKAINRLGRVDEGNTTSDYDPEETRRKISINLSVLTCQWQGTKLNLIDTPGYPDFIGEVKAGLRVADGALLIVSAADGVQVGTEKAWGYAQETGLPRIILVNKMDRDNADFIKIVKDLQARFGKKCVPLQLPIGAQADFKGIVDLLALKAYQGSELAETEVPASLKGDIGTCRDMLVEAVAESNDDLLEKYLDGRELGTEELAKGLRQAVVAGGVVPILAGSALHNLGTSLLLETMLKCLPAPKERPVVSSVSGKTETSPPGEEAPLAALVFKTTADPYVGKLTYFRVYNGVIASNSQVWNVTRQTVERIGQLYILRGKNQEPVTELRAGDIGAVAKLSVTATGDTLASREHPVLLPPAVFPAPLFSEAVYPKGKTDVDKMGPSLARLVEEDPTLAVRRQTETGEVILSGMGDTQLAVAAERLQRKFGVAVTLSLPKVPYRETITVPSKAEHKHKKQTGGHGQYGHVLLELEPLPRGSGAEFAERVVGGSIPRNFIPAVEKGVHEALTEGALAGYPIVDLRATVYDGSFHPVDSSEICFKIAGSQALKKGVALGQPILIEPVMNLSVTVPEEFTGDVIGDLNTKRGRVHGMNPQSGQNIIEAQVPQAEILRYAIDLKSLTQGRGSFTASFSHYEQTPPNVQQKIVAEKEAAKAAA